MNDDTLVFLEENDEPAKMDSLEDAWKILIADDDPDVHETTVFSLKDSIVLGKPLHFLHAYSGQEAIGILQKHADVALILLDAIMETENAGLETAHAIRQDLGLEDVRIILRTGQPGQVPELEAITKYDINDYKTKSELSRTKLMTALVAALRSWQQIRRLQNSRHGLEKIIAASNRLIGETGLKDFAEGVISQMASLLGLDPEGIVCVSRGLDAPNAAVDQCQVIAAAGQYRCLINRPLASIKAEAITASVKNALVKKTNIIEDQSLTIYFSDPSGRDYATWIGASAPLREIDTHLLEIFCTNISLCASNVELVSRIQRQAWEDPLLQMPNLASLLETMNNLLKKPAAQPSWLAILDIAGFNQINELLGHSYGDTILKTFVEQIRQVLGKVFVARIGADVFAIVGREKVVAEHSLQSLTSRKIQTPDGERELAVSIGLTRIDSDEGDGSAQLRNGYLALKRAKEEGAGKIVTYSRDIGLETRKRILLLHELRGGLGESQLFLMYQPQIKISNRQVFCCEALLRWRNRTGDMIPPDQFIPLAEQAGLIVPIGVWVLQTALHDLKRIHQAGYVDFHMAVNVSAMQFRSKDFLSQLDAALQQSGVAPQFLELEITESISALGNAEVLRILNAIRERGISIAIDDFGTGYSSLSTIDRWPINRLKIDRSFVQNMDRQEEGARLVDLIIPLGNRLSMKVIAEGVETQSQMSRLEHLGCDEIQGYLISKPLIFDELLLWLQAASPQTGQ